MHSLSSLLIFHYAHKSLRVLYLDKKYRMQEKSLRFKEINSFLSWWPLILLCLPNTASNISQYLSGSSIPDIWNHKLVEIDVPINPRASSHLFSHLIFLSSSMGSVSFLDVILKSPLLCKTSSIWDFHEKKLELVSIISQGATIL